MPFRDRSEMRRIGAFDSRGGTSCPCATAPKAGFATCFARVVTVNGVVMHGRARANATPSGYGPADIRSAYALGSASSGGRTVAIVDAYNDPTATSCSSRPVPARSPISVRA
jgi:hypothetical protein